MRLRPILVVVLILVLAVALGVSVVFGLRFLPPPESVTYSGRDYIEPRTISAAEVTRDWPPLRDTHTTRRGLALFVPRSVSRGVTPTVVLLRRRDGRYEVYGLSGGP
jgi:hypothetical protein